MNTTTENIKPSLYKMNAKCLIQISKFAQALYKLNGIQLRLQDKDIIQKIVQQCKQNNDDNLNSIYRKLEQELRLNYASKKEKRLPESNFSFKSQVTLGQLTS